jgi:hypothetical protein
MKKTISLFIFLIVINVISIAQSAIVSFSESVYSDANYDSYNHHEWYFSGCYGFGNDNLIIELEKTLDNYDIQINPPELAQSIYLSEYSKEIYIDQGSYDKSEFYISISSLEGVVLDTIVGRVGSTQIDSLSLGLSRNHISGDTISICNFSRNSTLSKLSIEVWQKEENTDTMRLVDYGVTTSNINYYKNGERGNNNGRLDDQDYENGDTLLVSFSYAYQNTSSSGGFPNCDLATKDGKELFSKPYVVKIPEPHKDLIIQLNGSDSICPGEVFRVAKTELVDTNASWNWDGYIGGGDTLNIDFRTTVLLRENYSWKYDRCPIFSEAIRISWKDSCEKGYYQGYAREANSYDPVTKKYNSFEGLKMVTNSGLITTTGTGGYFEIYYDESEKFTEIKIQDEEYFSAAKSVYYNSSFPSNTYQMFYTYLLKERDLSVSLTSGRNRPGFTIPYFITIENQGKDTIATSVSVALDANLTYTSLPEENKPDVVGNNLIWNNLTLASGEIVRLKFYTILDSQTAIDTELNNSAYLTMAEADSIVENDTAVYMPSVTGSFDPNDKLVSYQGIFNEGYVSDSTSFDYTINFQNTGNDTAFNVVVVDVMPTALDLTTFQMIASSHNYSLKIKDDTVSWTFSNILLPDSNINEPLSHGHIRFSIQQKKDNPEGTTINNKAFIYFDFNDAIITNETAATVNNNWLITSQDRKVSTKVLAYPNPAKHFVIIEGISNGYLEVFNSSGKKVINSITNGTVDVSLLPSGYYYFNIIQADKVYTGPIVVE